jgi:hypothetical protein
MPRTQKQKDLLQRVIDWMKAGSPHVQINEKVSLNGFYYSKHIKTETLTENHCGTLACIAGAAYEFAHAESLVPPLTKYSEPYSRMAVNDWIGDEAQHLLGVSDKEASLLFAPFEIWNEDLPEQYVDDDLHYADCPLAWTENLPPEEIAKVLQKFNDTDVIDWHLVAPKNQADPKLEDMK